MKTKHRHYPKVLKTFRKLEGGKFGYLDVIARSPGVLELALGDDFLRFSREQAFALANVMADWMTETRREDEPPCREETEVVEEAIVEERIETRPKSRGRRADSV